MKLINHDIRALTHIASKTRDRAGTARYTQRNAATTLHCGRRAGVPPEEVLISLLALIRVDLWVKNMLCSFSCF